MHVEELIIDGFKSYAARTHITGWDHEFNAITGLNGSGKSNVLDAICFVLGIRNYKLLRANNIQDLIYKRGQAGITKASVTVVFRNDDRKASPLGYEDCKQISLTRQIMVGGKNKYMINGHTAQEQAVANMLQSVQLSINNPHFLIMQGKITQVLNMQPPEILAMIEEAAGTRMFEERKDRAQKTMAKKDKKMEEISSILAEEITPKLDKLRGEKQAYLEYQKVEIELDRLRRLVVAYDYTKCEEALKNGTASLESGRTRLEEMASQLETVKIEIANIGKSRAQIEETRRKEMAKSGEFKSLQEKVDELSKELVRIKTQSDLKTTSISEEQVAKAKLLESKSKLEGELAKRVRGYEKQMDKYAKEKRQYDEKTKDVTQLEELLQSLTTGVASDEGREGGFMQQLQEAKKEASDAATAMEQAKLRIGLLKDEAKEINGNTKKALKDNTDLLKEKERLEAQAANLDTKLKAHEFKPEAKRALEQQRAEMLEQLDSIDERRRGMEAQMTSFDFQYQDPVRNFDRNKVKGLVAQLINIEDKNKFAAVALEITAGGRIYNVIVDNDDTGALLLKNGKLRRRVTIIPLNKIAAHQLDQSIVNFAKNLAPGKVDTALSLVGYPAELEKAMAYVFGTTFVCKDPQTAEQMAFHKNIRKKAVTLEGDVYDPAGTMQGGAKPSSAGILGRLQTLKNARQQHASLRKELASVEAQLAAMEELKDEHMQLSREYDLAKHKLSLIEQQLSYSSYAQMTARLEEIKTELAAQEEVIPEANSKRDAATKRAQTIEGEMGEFSKDKGGKIKQLKKKLATLKEALPAAEEKIKECQRVTQEATLEKEEFESEIIELQTQADSGDAAIAALTAEHEEIEATLARTREELDDRQAEFSRVSKKLQVFDKELGELDELHRSKQSHATTLQLESEQLAHELERAESTQGQHAQKMAALTKEHAWIADQQHAFGQEGTAYDFVTNDPVQARRRLRKLEGQVASMRKTTNTAVMTNIESVTKREAALKQMLKTVVRDKRKIEDTIQSLDKYKVETLERTWQLVDKDFGAIFAELLPGNTSRLETLEGQPLAAGLAIRVSLGGVWKQSLAELSGGQRSLIALSLILSLLQFKPAPMYVLDEIDAALDPSHTQNIGQLFRTRFKGSQFIVVSLKEGMFNNANVVFRARFRNGISMVDRLAHD
ncbi:RecF/RecN/SMC protein [Coemansia reversa NRRL 1564]|uniref:Structural maintenance of chromosomes protein n=1 Tax=Coemansia reversa (strain ATCC 12441 / NRRL 1564) TaxID=763665 RepID=A0A2G5BI77_COERN|nr:RecF/RecN/SMC protein [Coemansia reversa NRRL 1564]|eukprot:PIA18728.1 RecF/RecN/SMC protein [Coemansia reversa NRRL 1564]